MKTYAIADLHGRWDLLSMAIMMIDLHREGEPVKLVVTGDFVDRGPDSRKIITFLRQFHWDGIELVVLKGNHEDMMVQCGREKARLDWWIGHGGGRTLMSYGYRDGDALVPYKGGLASDLDWLDGLPLYHDDGVRVFVHAHLDPAKPLAEQNPDAMMWTGYDRGWTWPSEDDGEHQPAGYPDRHVVHGHEQWAKGPILLEDRTNLDTFAWHTGRLAIGVFDETKSGPVDVLWAEGEAA